CPVQQCRADRRPGFSTAFADLARLGVWPGPGAFVVRIRPVQDLLFVERGQVEWVSCPALFGQQAGQRGTAWQAAPTMPQGCVHVTPGFADRPGNRTTTPTWPGTNRFAVGIRPAKDFT